MGDPTYSPDGKWLWSGREWVPVINPSSIESGRGNESSPDSKSSGGNVGFWDALVSNPDKTVEIDNRSVSQKIKDMEDQIKSLEEEIKSQEDKKYSITISKLNKAKQLIDDGNWRRAEPIAKSCLSIFKEKNDLQHIAKAEYILGKCDYLHGLSSSTELYFKSSEAQINRSMKILAKNNDQQSVLECMVVLRDIAQARLNISSGVSSRSNNQNKIMTEDGIDVGSHIGLVLDGEEVFGTIVEFDDEEGTVTIEEDGTGDLFTGYQDDMFLE